MLCLQSDKAENVTGCLVMRDLCVHTHVHSSCCKISMNFIRDVCMCMWEGVGMLPERNDPS